METTPDGPPEPPATIDPFIGRDVAGKYHVVRRLGVGAMGAVYLARHLATEGDVAIKFLHATALGDGHAVRRFRLEAQNVAALKHANTVRVIDFGVDGATLYLVMEYLAGQPLSDVLVRDGPLPLERAVHILRQVLKSLWEAHEHPKQIIHRDIKPANIFLVDLPGEPDHVRVLDFGISRALGGSGAGTHGLIGTPFYMAPELWKGEAADARTDLYALGCVAYQMLVGAPPFVPPPSAGDNLYPLLELHLHAQPTPIAEARPELPRPIAAWVERMLAKEPTERPASAREALEALAEAVRAADSRPDAAARGTHPPPPTRGTRPTPSTRGTSATPSTIARPPDKRPTPSASRPSGLPTWVLATIAVIVLAAIAVVIVAVTRPPKDAAGSAPMPATFTGAADDEAPPPASFGNLLMSYRARLSAADHLDEEGDALDDAAAVVALDRRRYHAGVGDPEDGFDAVFKDEAMQAQLYQLVDRFLDAPTRRAILDGQPLIEVAIYDNGVAVKVLAE